MLLTATPPTCCCVARPGWRHQPRDRRDALTVYARAARQAVQPSIDAGESQEILKRGLSLYGEPHCSAGSDSGDPTVREERLAQLRPGQPGEVLPPLGPVEASACEGSFAWPYLLWVQPEGVGHPGQAGRGECEAAGLVQEPCASHRVGHGDAESSGEVVVTGAATSQGGAGGNRSQTARGGRAGFSLGRQIFEEVRDRGAGELHVPVTALAVLDEQATVDEAMEVLGRGGGRDAGVGREFARGPGTAVEQREAHGRPRLVGQQSRERRQVRG